MKAGLRNILILSCSILLILALAGCGNGAQTSGASAPEAETSGEKTGETPAENPEANGETEPEAGGTMGELQFGAFPGKIGADPNTLYQTDGSMVFAEDVIYFSNRTGALYQVGYDGSGLMRLDEEAMGPGSLNYYDGKLYYRCAKEVRCFDPETQQVEILVAVEPGKNLSRGGKTYTAYSEINSVFLVDDILFFLETDGYYNTSELTFHRLYALDLNSGEQQLILEDDILRPVYFSLDEEFLYMLPENMRYILRLDREKMQNGIFEMEETLIGGMDSDFRNAVLLAQNGFAYISDDDTYCSLLYSDFLPDDICGGNKELLYTEEALAGAIQWLPKSTNYLLGSSLISIQSKDDILRYPLGDFSNPESVGSCDIQAASGIYNQTVYLVVADSHTSLLVSLITIDEAGTVTSYPLDPLE